MEVTEFSTVAIFKLLFYYYYGKYDILGDVIDIHNHYYVPSQ